MSSWSESPPVRTQPASWLQLRAAAELELRRRRKHQPADLTRYQNDPVGFGREVLGERYTSDVVAMMESVRDNPVTIARSSNAVGKTHSAARIATWFFKVFPDAQVYTAAAPPEANLRRLLWGELGMLVQHHPGLFAGDRVIDLHIERNPKSFITGVTIPLAGSPADRESKFSGKHAPHLLFIVDEGDAVPIEVYRGIESCMSGGHARLLIMFNPRARLGPVWTMERERRASVVELSAFRHPNVRQGRDVIPGAVSSHTVVRRINQWSRPLAPGEAPEVDCFEVPAFLIGRSARSQSGEIYPPLKGGWRKVTDPALFYMVLAEYPPEGESQLISQVWIEQAQARHYQYVATYGQRPPDRLRPVLGLDVAEFGRDLNVLAARYGSWVPPLVSWNGMDPDETAVRAAEIYRRLTARGCGVDATGVGAGVAARMRRAGASGAFEVKVAARPTRRVDPNEPKLGEFSQLRDQLWWSLREWLRIDPAATLPPDAQLAEELAAPSYQIKNGKLVVTGKETLKELLGRSPDRAEALMLTFAGPEMRPARRGRYPFGTDFRG